MAITTSGTSITFNDATVQTTAAGFAAGTVLLFYQSAAPTGWTQLTALNDYDLRLVSSAGGTTGGTTAYSTVFANQTVSTTVSGTSGATTLATSQIPSHTHTYSVQVYNPCASSGSTSLGGNSSTTLATGAEGGGGSHTHSFSGSGTSSAVTLNVRYANIIICSKN